MITIARPIYAPLPEQPIQLSTFRLPVIIGEANAFRPRVQSTVVADRSSVTTKTFCPYCENEPDVDFAHRVTCLNHRRSMCFAHFGTINLEEI